MMTLVLASIAAMGMAADLRYELVPIHALTGKDFQLRDLNNRDQVLGEITAPEGTKGFICKDQKLALIPSLPGCNRMFAMSINDFGHVVGYGEFRRSPGEAIAYLYNGKSTLPLSASVSASSYAHGITNSGRIVGSIATKASRAVIWQAGKHQELAGPKRATFAYGGNDRGDVIGALEDKAVVWRDGKMSEIAGVYHAGAAAINDAGVIVGRTREGQAFLRRTDGAMSRLAKLDGFASNRAYSINKRDEVVGDCTAPESKRSVAVLWVHGKVLDLNGLLKDKGKWQLERAWAINDHGVILGSGRHEGKKAAFLLKPVVNKERR